MAGGNAGQDRKEACVFHVIAQEPGLEGAAARRKGRAASCQHRPMKPVANPQRTGASTATSEPTSQPGYLPAPQLRLIFLVATPGPFTTPKHTPAPLLALTAVPGPQLLPCPPCSCLAPPHPAPPAAPSPPHFTLELILGLMLDSHSTQCSLTAVPGLQLLPCPPYSCPAPPHLAPPAAPSPSPWVTVLAVVSKV